MSSSIILVDKEDFRPADRHYVAGSVDELVPLPEVVAVWGLVHYVRDYTIECLWAEVADQIDKISG